MDDIVKTFVGEEEEEGKREQDPEGDGMVMEDKPNDHDCQNSDKSAEISLAMEEERASPEASNVLVEEKQALVDPSPPLQREVKQPRQSKKGNKKKKGSSANSRQVKEVAGTKKEHAEGIKKQVIENKEPWQQRIHELEEMLKQREEQLQRQAILLNESQKSFEAADESRTKMGAIDSKLKDAEHYIKQLEDEKKALEIKTKGSASLEQQLKLKNSEIQEILQEGEALSKKQLQMETLIKQLRSQVSTLQEDVDDKTTMIENDKSRILALEKLNHDLENEIEMSKEGQDELMQSVKSEHEKTIKELRTELIAAERKMENMEKSGASRKLRDAESKCEALQNSIESLREEMRRQRQNADEREDMLSAEIAMLQEKCSEAEVRQQDFENKLTQATSPLLREMDLLRKKLEDQERLSMTSEKRLMEQIAKLDAERHAMAGKLESLRDSEEEARLRCDGLQSQLLSAQQSSVESERIATEAKAAKDKVEALLREAKAEVAAIEKSSQSNEKLFYSQIEAMTSRESTLRETIRSLEEDVCQLTQQVQEVKSQEPIRQSVQVEDTPSRAGDFSTPIDESEDGIRRKIKELESTRDHLSNELVKAEQKLAEGNAAKVLLDSQTKEISDLRKKVAAATELLGEKEERIEELRADLQDMREGYKQQLIIMADEVSRLTKKEKVVEEFLS